LQANSRRKPPKRVSPTPPPLEEVLLESLSDLNPAWQTAAKAAEEKQAVDLHVLDLRGVTPMADLFLICHGRNPRQIQAIADEIEKQLKDQDGERPLAIEGMKNAEWVLMDYGDFVVHIFSEKARAYYDLERLYREARQVAYPPESAA
jgi:ribosome-associated protein